MSSIEATGWRAPASVAGAFWSLDRVCDALGDGPRGPTTINRIWTDTRSIQAGDLFVALRGEHFDAHDFAREAVAQGAIAVVVSDERVALSIGVPAYVVPDTLLALGLLGAYRRRVWGRPVIGVVGTNGKTSTKELLKAALGSRLQVHATAGNLNNLVGVPLTLLALPDDADVAVVEMGTNQPGEVARLRQIVDPSIVVVTSIAEEHLEGLGDLEGVLREEMAGCDDVGLAIVPASQPEVVDAARSRAKRVAVAGLERGDVHADSFSIGDDGAGSLTVTGVPIRVPLRGLHNLRNAMLALAACAEAGVSMEDAARGIASMPTPPMRSNVARHGRAVLINDAYNSNPGSARAALELLAHAGRGRQRVAVLGSMLELGPSGPRLHDEIAREALASGIEVVAGVGEMAAALGRVAGDDPRALAVPEVEALWASLSQRLEPDAVILLKGSRGVRLERLVPAIAEWAGDATP
ncbi:MAG: UDP-N-acetylmuramoylalanyl-D-glutamyl-2,6-diaminopimelate/D-alanyl-D-alanyl ligase [Gemmatimonadetes bacterium]|nr:UDP-N-acetylmuramoylalanyl-D-glutamyl-2,6-diaminopimelate/D-alanyl-D-alanyl ligase [Gemmatimonadota bacterium]